MMIFNILSIVIAILVSAGAMAAKPTTGKGGKPAPGPVTYQLNISSIQSSSNSNAVGTSDYSLIVQKVDSTGKVRPLAITSMATATFTTSGSGLTPQITPNSPYYIKGRSSGTYNYTVSGMDGSTPFSFNAPIAVTVGQAAKLASNDENKTYSIPVGGRKDLSASVTDFYDNPLPLSDTTPFTFSISSGPGKFGSKSLAGTAASSTLEGLSPGTVKVAIAHTGIANRTIFATVTVQPCSSGTHEENGSCVPDSKMCPIADGIGTQIGSGEQIWSSANSTYETCQVKTCFPEYSVDLPNNTCKKIAVTTSCANGQFLEDGECVTVSAPLNLFLDYDTLRSGVDRVTLEWEHGPSYANYTNQYERYEIYRKVDSGEFVFVGTGWDSFDDEDIVEGKTYTYKVRMENEGLFSKFTPEKTYTLKVRPLIPYIFEPDASSTQIYFKFHVNSSIMEAEKITVYRKLNDEPFDYNSPYKVYSVEPWTEYDFIDDVDFSAGKYSYVLRSSNGTEFSYDSKVRAVSGPIFVAPSFGLYNQAEEMKINLDYQFGIEEYVIERADFKGYLPGWNFKIIGTAPGLGFAGLNQPNYYVDSSAVAGTMYIYRIKVVSGSESLYSPESVGQYLSKPVMSVTNKTSSSVTISWQPVDGAAKYHVSPCVGMGAILDSSQNSVTFNNIVGRTECDFHMIAIGNKFGEFSARSPNSTINVVMPP